MTQAAHDPLTAALSSLSLDVSAPTSQLSVVFQDACLLHAYTRPHPETGVVELDGIVERPERLRAAKVGVAAAHSRLSSLGDRAVNVRNQGCIL